jgi:hypothetical protein
VPFFRTDNPSRGGEESLAAPLLLCGTCDERFRIAARQS